MEGAWREHQISIATAIGNLEHTSIGHRIHPPFCFVYATIALARGVGCVPIPESSKVLDKDHESWIPRATRISPANECTNDALNIPKGQVVLKGIAERWDSCVEHAVTANGYTWDGIRALFLAIF